MTKGLIWLLAAMLAGCGGGAVVFAPTPIPLDATPTRYAHPAGVFSIALPRTWSLYEQYTTTLASAAFAPPGAEQPALLLAVIDLGRDIDTALFADLIGRYQTQVRPDVGAYTEQHREAMGDGSWRFTGLRTLPGGATEQVNTFLLREGSHLGLIEVVVPEAAAAQAALEQIINSFALTPNDSLQPAELTTLSFARRSGLSILHVAGWSTPEGVFFITGEVANHGTSTLTGLPIEAALLTADGAVVAGAIDTVMGHGIAPGGFAPFSLRFGQGQPSGAREFLLRIGGEVDGEIWLPDPEARVVGAEALSWTDESTFDELGRLHISGIVTNNGERPVRDLRAIATIFDGAGSVIGAAFLDIEPAVLAAGEEAPFALMLPELGGDPVNYIVTVQGLP